MKCSICGNPIDIQFNGWTEGHNAEPVNSGRCCTACNDMVVIPARLNLLTKAGKKETTPQEQFNSIFKFPPEA